MYSKNICKQMIAYFRKSTESQNIDGRPAPVRFPTFEAFATSRGLTVATLKEWRGLYDEFDECAKICLDIQKSVLVEYGLAGKFNPVFARYLLCELGGISTDKDRADFSWIFEFSPELDEESQ